MAALKKKKIPDKQQGQQGKSKKHINKTKVQKPDANKKPKKNVTKAKVKNKSVKRSDENKFPIKHIELILCFGYKFIKVLGKGSEGTVFLAEHLHRGELVAIKTLDMEQRWLWQYVQKSLGLGEFCYWSHLNHPNLMKLLEKVAYPEHIFFVMEYMSNDTLLDYIHRNRLPVNIESPPLYSDEQLMIKWSRELFVAIQYLHNLGLYHLDIKPNNVFLDGYWNLKLGDFGFLRAKDDLCPRIFVGCPFYMPPETLTVETITNIDLEKVDVWSCGVTVLEMLTGRLISGRDFFLNPRGMTGKALFKNITVNLQSLKEMNIGYPGGKDFVLALLQCDPDTRPTATMALTHPWLRLQRNKLKLPDSLCF